MKLSLFILAAISIFATPSFAEGKKTAYQQLSNSDFWKDDWRSKTMKANMEELEAFEKKAEKMSQRELHALVVEYRLKSGAVCIPGGMLVGTSAILETLPVLNFAGTIIGRGSNPDYKNSHLTPRLDYFLGSIMGGAFAAGMNRFQIAMNPWEDNYMTNYAYAGTITSKEALFGKASTCWVLRKKAEIAKKAYLRDENDPRVLAHQYSRKHELRNVGREPAEAPSENLSAPAI